MGWTGGTPVQYHDIRAQVVLVGGFQAPTMRNNIHGATKYIKEVTKISYDT